MGWQGRGKAGVQLTYRTTFRTSGGDDQMATTMRIEIDGDRMPARPFRSVLVASFTHIHAAVALTIRPRVVFVPLFLAVRCPFEADVLVLQYPFSK
jgi:hypothetical protein